MLLKVIGIPKNIEILFYAILCDQKPGSMFFGKLSKSTLSNGDWFQESFYRDLDPKESEKASKGEFNFDHPDAFDMKLMEKCLKVGFLIFY